MPQKYTPTTVAHTSRQSATISARPFTGKEIDESIAGKCGTYWLKIRQFFTRRIVKIPMCNATNINAAPSVVSEALHLPRARRHARASECRIPPASAALHFPRSDEYALRHMHRPRNPTLVCAASDQGSFTSVYAQVRARHSLAAKLRGKWFESTCPALPDNPGIEVSNPAGDRIFRRRKVRRPGQG